MPVSSVFVSMPASFSAEMRSVSTEVTHPEPEPPPCQSVDAHPNTFTLVASLERGNVPSLARRTAPWASTSLASARAESLVAVTAASEGASTSVPKSLVTTGLTLFSRMNPTTITATMNATANAKKTFLRTMCGPWSACLLPATRAEPFLTWDMLVPTPFLGGQRVP